jgi:twitching motility protein PilT
VTDILSIIAGTPVEAMLLEHPGDFENVVEYGARQLLVKVTRSPTSLQVLIRTAAPRTHESIPIELNEPTLVTTILGVKIDREASRASTAPDFAKVMPTIDTLTLPSLIMRARDEGISDVHFVSGESPRIRQVGRLLTWGAPVSHDQLAAMLDTLLDAPKRASLEQRGYTDFSTQMSGIARMRVNICRQRTGLKACFRLIPERTPTLETLQLPAELAKVQDYHQGLIVISGPNGHGKTTTLAALVNLFNETRPAHIITVEDPVEFLHLPKRAVVSQREVGVHTRSFQTALKGALREDPDIIAIGELRDRETVEMALTASETGHVVLATMSTPNGASTIERLIDMFAPEDQSQVRATLAGALKLIISQRLVPTCDGTRFVPAAELITGNIPLWTLIRDNKLYQLPSLLQRGRGYGMIRVEDSLNEWVERGVIDVATARAFADEPKNIAQSPRPADPAISPPVPAISPGMMGMFRKKG